MKKIEWENPNKMKFESYYKTFNKQTNYIDTGNVVANTQYSTFVRTYNETKCNGFDFPQGHLQDYDFEKFEAPSYIKNEMRQLMKNQTKDCIAYNFHVWQNGQRKDIGFVLTDYDHHLIKYWVMYGRNITNKRESAILEAIKYITE